jgi:hypothetical protein
MTGAVLMLKTDVFEHFKNEMNTKKVNRILLEYLIFGSSGEIYHSIASR